MWCFASTCLVRLLLKRLVAILIVPSLSSLITMLSSISGVKKPFTCRRKRSLLTTSASATYYDSDNAAAVTFKGTCSGLVYISLTRSQPTCCIVTLDRGYFEFGGRLHWFYCSDTCYSC